MVTHPIPHLCKIHRIPYEDRLVASALSVLNQDDPDILVDTHPYPNNRVLGLINHIFQRVIDDPESFLDASEITVSPQLDQLVYYCVTILEYIAQEPHHFLVAAKMVAPDTLLTHYGEITP